MRINLIYARARNGVIGRDNSLPWHLPQDMAHFKRETGSSPVIMGRKTWDSLPPKFRPLPGRANLVVTRQRDWQHSGVQVVNSLEQALAVCAQMQPAPADIWIIGGAQLYAAALEHAQRALVTELAQDFDGDAMAPVLGRHWIESARSEQIAADGMAFAFVTYTNSAHRAGPT